MILETFKQFFAEPMDMGVITTIAAFVYLAVTALFLRVLGFNGGRDNGLESEDQGELGQPRAGTSFQPRMNTHERES
jgi:hypothetical protein